jgi:5-methylthioadenosine/S-adenosylhomocysteine deaminase
MPAFSPDAVVTVNCERSSDGFHPNPPATHHVDNLPRAVTDVSLVPDRNVADPNAARTVLDGGVVVTMNDSRQVLARGTVVMDDAHLAYVGPQDGYTARPGDRVVDRRGLVLMPGLVDTHTHTCMALFRGLGDDRPRRVSAPTFTLAEQARATPQDYYWGAVLGGLEMLANGITCTADRFSHMGLIAEAFDRMGMRAVVCHTLWDVGRPLEWEEAVALVDRWGTDPQRRVHCGIGPHAPDTCSDAFLRRVRAFATASGARIFIHCAQSEVEVAAVRSRGHCGSIHCLAATGVLGPDAVLAHCIYVDDDEIDLLARTGAWVSHCPVSNAKIEARVAPVARMLQGRVRVALGTDWAPTNNGMDLFDEMKNAGLLNKIAADDPTVLPVDRLLAMATIDAARALGLERQVGGLEAGKRADVIALSMDGLHLQPWRNVPFTLVYAAKGMDVRHVWVDGRQVVRERAPVAVDAAEVRARVAEIVLRLA